MADRVITLTTDGMGTNGVPPYDGQRHAYRSDQAESGILIFDHLEILDGSDPGYDQMGGKRYDLYRGMQNGGSG